MGILTVTRRCLTQTPYGNDHPVEKIECVGHVQKRMGTRLRNLKSKLGQRHLADGKTIGGRGRLTKDQIDNIQTHYGNAIRGNTGDLVGTRRAIRAVYFHQRSTDADPTHDFCLVSWCPYRKAQANNTVASF